MAMRRVGAWPPPSPRDDQPRAAHHWRRGLPAAAANRRDVRGSSARRSPAPARPGDGARGHVRAARVANSRRRACTPAWRASRRWGRSPSCTAHRHRAIRSRRWAITGRTQRTSPMAWSRRACFPACGSSRDPGSTAASLTSNDGTSICGRSTRGPGRLTVNATPRLSLSGWYGFLKSPEELTPDESTRRYGASVLFAHPIVADGMVEHAALGRQRPRRRPRAQLRGRDRSCSSADTACSAATSSCERAPRICSCRARRSSPSIRSSSATRGISCRRTWLSLGVGARVSVNFIPASLAESYETRRPVGFAVYLRARPPAIE